MAKKTILLIGGARSGKSKFALELARQIGEPVLFVATATAGGVIQGKIIAKFSRVAVNTILGAAGVSAVPMSARVVQKMAQKENPRAFLLMHAMT